MSYDTNTISYSSIVSILLKQMNKIRHEPRSFLPALEQRLRKYDDDTKQFFPIPDRNIVIQTKEGADGVKQLMRQLNTMQVSPSFTWSYELHQAADARAQELSSSHSEEAYSDHQDEQASKPQHRKPKNPKLMIDQLVTQYADWKGDLSQHVFYGFIDPKELLSQILIDDGNPEKQHRKQFFNPEMHCIGIGVEPHYKYKFVVVIIYSTFAEKKRPMEMQEIDIGQGCGEKCVIM